MVHHCVHRSLSENAVTGDANICGEIEEVDEEDGEKTRNVDQGNQKQDFARNQIMQEGSLAQNKKIVISPEVQQALATLEKAIAFIRENGCNSNFKSMCRNKIENSQSKDEPEDSKLSGFNQVSMSNGIGTATEIFRKESAEITSYEHRISSCSHCSR